MILFNSLEFIFRFLPVFLIIYYLTPARFRQIPIFLGSIVFYALGAGYMAAGMVVLTISNYFLGKIVFKGPAAARDASRRKAFVCAVAVDAGALVLCKILAAYMPGFVLPLGFSFYIFKMISYQADLFGGKIVRRPTLMDTAVYFAIFTQVTQGPIMRYNEGGFESQERKGTLRSVSDGVFFFVMGLGMKVLLADKLSILWNEIQKIGYESISTPLAWMGAVGYSLQLYMDFWGYSLMAAGLGMMLGFHFVINFLHPYWGCGIADFYRRWHATLGAWFRDYVYIPLGGSRKGTLRTIGNLLIVWALTGLWHGGTVNFLIWGLVLAVLIIWEKFVAADLISFAPIVGHLHVWLLIPLTWVIFAIPNLTDLMNYYMRLFPFFKEGINVNPGDLMKYLSIYAPFLAVSLVLCAPHTYRLLVKNRRSVPVIALMVVVFWFSVYQIVISASNPFMYFSF